MQITIDIIDRNYEQIKEFCVFNKIKIEDYIVQCAEDDFFTRKYGDLNEKLTKPKEQPKAEETPPQEVKEVREIPKVEEETPKKKVGRPKKVVEETPTVNDKETKINEMINNSEQVLIKKENIIDTSLQNKTTRVKRTLKVK